MQNDRPMTTREVAHLLKVSSRYVRQIKDRIGGWEIRAGTLFFAKRNVDAFASRRAK